MSTHRNIDWICILALIAALVLLAALANGEALGLQAADRVMGYEERLFTTDRVHTIDLVIEDWDSFLSTAQSEAYTVCSVVIDGETIRNVGIRGKGNTSLSSVSSLDSQRYSLKLEFDQYDTGKTYHGLDKLSLNNLIQDTTYMKDYLTYRMMAEFGAAAPLCSYVFLTVNGEDWGLYLAVEAVEEAFLQRNYGSDVGELYKPDTMNMGAGRGNGRDFNMEDFDLEAMEPPGEKAAAPNMEKMPDRIGFGGMGGSEATLQYVDDNPDSYAAIFDSVKTEITAADQARLIHSLKALNEGNVEASVDVEAVLRYFVVHNFVVNGDSYTGSMVHNYYLYEKDGKLSMIPWDYNLAFGTFQSLDANRAVNDDIDSPLSVTGSGDRPMVDWILQDAAYTECYHQLFSEFLQTVDVLGIIEETATLIAPYVERDPTAFYSAAEFETGVETLQEFCRLRLESVKNQLSGSTETVDASSLNLADLGTMQMGGEFGSRGDRAQQPEDPSRMPEMGGRFPGKSGDMAAPPNGIPMDNFPGGMETVEVRNGTDVMPLVISLLVLAVGMITAIAYKRKR